ncbi:RDD family protein [Kitasatospora sp. NPDC006697]|uniref:RDD family protein n=1 Tax=Kitasatospora sp. NPDC006697 TaxID=3364020 RepID=UPI00368B7838
MSYPPDPNNPYGQPQQAPYGVPPQQSPYAQPPGYGYPQQGAPQYGYPQQAAAPQYGYAPPPAPVLASWGSRVGAYLIDSLVVSLPATIGIFVGASMVATSLRPTSCPTYDPNDPTTADCVPTLASTSSGMSGGGLAVMIVGFLLTLVLGIWLLVMEGSNGQTIGKKALGIRLVREYDGRPLGFGMAFVRKLAHVLDSAACYLGWLWPLWDEKSQCFADKVTGSLVIRA